MGKELEEVPPVEKDENGNIIINLAANAANADWIRAARKIKEGKNEEVKEMEYKKMYRVKKKKTFQTNYTVKIIFTYN